MSASRPAGLVLVQHAHQHLVTDGYQNREGVFDLHRALVGLLHAHLARRVPLALDVTGTLTEALAWYVPQFRRLVRRMHEEGLLELVGSAYAQNVMPLFSAEHNRRQLAETLWLYEKHYGVPAEQVRCLWVPERVWHTERLADVVTDPTLPNGGYRWVLLDDRHAYRSAPGSDEVSRAEFDAGSAPAVACGGGDPSAPRSLPGGDGRHLYPYRLADAEDLVVLSLSSELRYALPLRGEAQADHLGRVLDCATAAGPDGLLVFGDDAERSAGVGAWGPRPWHERELGPYAATLDTLAADSRVAVTLPAAWLAGRDVGVVRHVDPAGFYELVAEQGAGEDYRCFWDAAEWRPYREHLESVERLLCTGSGSALRGGLWDAAWKQLMVSSYETGWQERDGDARYRPAPWARAVASHVREARLLATAAAQLDRPGGELFAQLGDLDGEGHDEVLLRNDALFVAVSPHFGGRIVLVCDLSCPGGRIVVGNLADDWNWQEEPHQFMRHPRNHPGALADVGAENDAYAVADLRVNATEAVLVLLNVEPDSPLRGLRKTLRLAAGAAHLDVCYVLPPGCPGLSVEFALSPDYLSLLREGRGLLRPLDDDSEWRHGFAAGATTAWVEVDMGQPVVWNRPVQPECGHASVLSVTGWGTFDLRLGAGRADVEPGPASLQACPQLVVSGGRR